MLLDATGKPQAVMAQPNAGIAACQRSTTSVAPQGKQGVSSIACSGLRAKRFPTETALSAPGQLSGLKLAHRIGKMTKT